MTPLSGVAVHAPDVAEPYCTDQPARLTGCAVGLNSSMKSLVRVAPVLPPPPYAWLMTIGAAGIGAVTVSCTVADFVTAVAPVPVGAVAVSVTALGFAATPVTLPVL